MLIKGENIIEAYCGICNKPITAADIRLGFAEPVDGKHVHIVHLQEIQENLAKPNVLDCIEKVVLAGLNESLSEEQRKQDMAVKFSTALIETGLSNKQFERCLIAVYWKVTKGKT